MAGKAGKTLLLKMETATPGTYQTIGGLRSKSLSINNEEIDATNHGSNEWKELLDGAGIRSMAISGSGIFTTDADLPSIITKLIAGTITNFQIIDSDGGLTFQGAYKITSFEYAGEYNAEQTYSMSLSSSGAITVS